MVKLIFLFSLLLTNSLRAEKSEYEMGASAGLIFPAFKSTESTDFALVSWTAGAQARFGLTKSLSLGLGFDFASFSGKTDDKIFEIDGANVQGSMQFNGVFYHPHLIARYKLYRGYNWAPYLEVAGGYLWSKYFEPQAVDASGRSLGLSQASFAEGSFTASSALMADMRFFNFLMVGVGIGYSHVFNGTLKRFFHAPITITAYF